jgi:hypothetical protein
MTLSRLGLCTLVLFLATAGVAEARTTVVESTEHTLKLHIELPRAQFVTREAGRERYVALTMEGMTTGGDPGKPGLPVATELFGIPQGADVSLRVSNVQSHEERDVLLYPAQPDPIDDGSPTPPFEIDERAYESASAFPAEPFTAKSLGTMRDVRAGGATIYGGQYTPRDRTLRVFESMDVTITFGGANRGVFATSNLESDWNIGFRDDYESLVNIDAIRDHLQLDDGLRFCGEELLIVTSHDLKPAALTLAGQRRDQGYLTRVTTTGSGQGDVGTTAEEIQAFIQDELTNPDCLVHPSYVILLGNTAHVPTHQIGQPDANGDLLATDHPYSLNGIGDDEFADTQVGRLPAEDLTAADAIVEKTRRYSSERPAAINDDFYRHATVTAFFQHDSANVANPTDSRTFTMAAERARTGMRADNYDVERLYFGLPATNPQFFNDGTPMPDELRKPGFAWDAGTSDFLNAFNKGRFLIMHRGHGSSFGWASPNLSINDVPSMTNGTQVPVVFAINCASARFDEPGNPSMVERTVMKPSGGAIAAFGDSRNSASNANTLLATGFYDAMFPDTDPGFAVTGNNTRRLGDILVRGKQYFAAKAADTQFVGENSIHGHFHLYGLFGDPTMQMWSNYPLAFDPDKIGADIEYNGPDLSVHLRLRDVFADGTVGTLFDGDRAIGRAVVRDGEAVIAPDAETDGRDLTVSLQQDGALPARVRVEG